MQSQLLLINSERFGLLLAENMNEVGMSLTIQTDNICKSYTKTNSVINNSTCIVIAAEIVNTTITEPITFNGTNERNSISIPADFIWERFSATGDVDKIVHHSRFIKYNNFCRNFSSSSCQYRI